MTRGLRMAAAVAALALTVTACGDDAPTSATEDTRQLEVVSWWTSGSEAAALEALFAAFRQSNPGVQAVNAAVAGGAGSTARVALAKRLQKDDPPDVWQTFAGKSVQGYASRGVIRSVASVFDAEDLRARLHPAILRSLMRDGRPYGVPTGAHRGNVLWFNKALLERAGVSAPSAGYTVDAFLLAQGRAAQRSWRRGGRRAGWSVRGTPGSTPSPPGGRQRCGRGWCGRRSRSAGRPAGRPAGRAGDRRSAAGRARGQQQGHRSQAQRGQRPACPVGPFSQRHPAPSPTVVLPSRRPWRRRADNKNLPTGFSVIRTPAPGSPIRHERSVTEVKCDADASRERARHRDGDRRAAR